ncbi:hypothetical protein SAMN04488689_11740 [Paenibacillus sp. cl6col]|nr:hypothetical protein SAMN04488689_11740 [Paenibacillus sp. cl6col]
MRDLVVEKADITAGYSKNETALARWKHELRLLKHFILLSILRGSAQSWIKTGQKCPSLFHKKWSS